jgi:hypothetical protein
MRCQKWQAELIAGGDCKGQTRKLLDDAYIRKAAIPPAAFVNLTAVLEIAAFAQFVRI